MPEITIYTTRSCPYCRSAKALLARKGAPYQEIDVSGDPERRAEMTRKADGGYTVPQIWIGATHVGGSDDLYALDSAGKLDPLLGR